MQIARVVGSAVSTAKDHRLIGVKLLVVQEADETGKSIGKPLVAVDSVGAGTGDLVLIASGSSARQTDVTQNRPVDTVIMAILDSLEVEGAVTYRKSPDA
jgi:microcompartment protein CcmK/EutM